MVKHIIFLSFALNCFTAFSQDTAKIVARSEVLSATTKEIGAAKEKMTKLISDPTLAKKYFDHFIMIGPHLWDRIKNLPEFKNIDNGNIIFKVPKFEVNGSWKKTVEVKGKAIQEKDDLENLFSFLVSQLDFSTATIVEKNDADKFTYWLYFAKIEEPLLAIENSKMRMIFQFTDKSLLFIELIK